MFCIKLRRVPAAVVLAMIAIEAGIDPAAVWDLTAKDFVDRVMAAKARRLS
jgi:hypothetical protein